jgi:hypothetical protein
MPVKWMKSCGILALVLVIAPILAFAQDQSPGYRSERGRNWPRGEIQVINDWQDDVRVSVWTHRRERVGEHWVVSPGETAVLAVDGDRVIVRPSYKIKVGDDWGWVNIGEVGQFQSGTWYVRARDIWRATHRERSGVPDWKRG